MPRSLFLFDLDGTLVDTAPDLTAAANKLRTDRGLAPLAYESLRPLTGLGASRLVEAALGVKPDEPNFEALRREFLSNYEHALAKDSTAFPGVKTLLEALSESGVLLGVVTNKQTDYARTILSAVGLAPLLAIVIGFDAPGAAMKPKPDAILTAMKMLGARPERTWYAGDSPSDASAAHAAGIPCAFADWGRPLAKAEEAGADFIAERPQCLYGWYLRSSRTSFNSASRTAS